MTRLLAVLFLAAAQASSPTVPNSIGRIDAIEGTGSVTYTRASRAYAAREAMLLAEGDELRTGDKVAVRIVYNDGSKQLLASRTRIRLHLMDGIPAPEFIEGAVDSQVKPETKPSNKPRFLFRTKAVVLGVRGTEFVVHTGPKGLEVHTLKGVVEIAQRMQELGTSKAIPIKEAFEVVGVSYGHAIPAPSSFVPAEFLGKVAQKYPELVKLLSN